MEKKHRTNIIVSLRRVFVLMTTLRLALINHTKFWYITVKTKSERAQFSFKKDYENNRPLVIDRKKYLKIGRMKTK